MFIRQISLWGTHRKTLYDCTFVEKIINWGENYRKLEFFKKNLQISTYKYLKKTSLLINFSQQTNYIFFHLQVQGEKESNHFYTLAKKLNRRFKKISSENENGNLSASANFRMWEHFSLHSKLFENFPYLVLTKWRSCSNLNSITYP